jgi:hypothetical protein
MAVYFAPERKSWLDYAAPLVMQLIGSGMERTSQAKAYELAKRTEEEALARRQQEADYNSGKARDIWARVSQPQPLSGPEQALNVAGYTPGAAMPATERTPDFRSNPVDFMGAFQEIAPYLPKEQIQANPLLMNNLNPNMAFQAVDQGDRATAGAFDPATGGFAGQEYMYGTNPTKQHEADARLQGDQLAADAQIRAALINAQGRGGRGQAAQLVTNPDTGTLVYIAPGQEPFDTGIPAMQQQTQSGLTPEQIANMYMSYEKGRSSTYDGAPQPENPIWPFVQPYLSGGQPQAQQMPDAGGNPFAGRLSDDAYRKARALRKSDAEIEAELKRLKR